MTYRDTITVGSIVQVAPGGDPFRHMTWRVQSTHDNGDGTTYATIVSGSSAQRRTYPIDKLSIYRVQETA